MQQQSNWFNPLLIDRIRKSISIIIWLIVFTVLGINHAFLIKIIQHFFS